jgi:hypothetical protein
MTDTITKAREILLAGTISLQSNRVTIEFEGRADAEACMDLLAELPLTPAPMNEDEALERWGDIQDDPDAIVECGERWKRVASAIGCELSGFNDGRSASFFTPDGNVIEVGPKFRAAITALHAHEPLPVKDEDAACPMCEGFGDDPLGCEACDNTGHAARLEQDNG